MKHSATIKGIAALSLLILVSGCGSGGSDGVATSADKASAEKTTTLAAAGDCIAGEVDDEGDKAPDLDTVADCSEPHLYEISAVVDLPDSVLSGETDEEKLANRVELATPSGSSELSSVKAQYVAFAEEACADAALGVVGWGSLSLQGVSADDAQLQPLALMASPVWINVMPEDEWLAGNTQLICSSRFSEPRLDASGVTVALPAAAPFSSPDAQPLMSHFATQGFPVELRACELAAEEGTRTYLGCDEEHYAEFLFTYDALAVLGADFVNAVDPAKVSDEQYARIDQVCIDALDQLLPGYDTERFKGLGELGSQGWGTVDAAYYQGQCTAAAEDSLNFNLPAGSLMGTDGAEVEPVPFE
jgi:hypothetical protein